MLFSLVSLVRAFYFRCILLIHAILSLSKNAMCIRVERMACESEIESLLRLRVILHSCSSFPDVIISFLIFFQPVHLSTRNPDLSPSHSHESRSSQLRRRRLRADSRIEQSNSIQNNYLYSIVHDPFLSRTQRFLSKFQHSKRFIGRFLSYRSTESLASR